MSEKKLLLIIPFYNEASRIASAELTKSFRLYPHFDFLLVNDGSTDTTASLLTGFSNDFPNVQVLSLAKNAGKAEAIRQGMQAKGNAGYSYVGYLDADMATPVSELAKMKVLADENTAYSFVMGSRIKKLGSTITRYTYRHYFGRVFATIVSKFILKASVYDTQCGAKIINYTLAQQLFDEPFITKWLFDIELLLRFKKADSSYLDKTYEFSLSIWTEKGDSKIRLKDLLGFPAQLIKIRFAYAK